MTGDHHISDQLVRRAIRTHRWCTIRALGISMQMVGDKGNVLQCPSILNWWMVFYDLWCFNVFVHSSHSRKTLKIIQLKGGKSWKSSTLKRGCKRKSCFEHHPFWASCERENLPNLQRFRESSGGVVVGLGSPFRDPSNQSSWTNIHSEVIWKSLCCGMNMFQNLPNACMCFRAKHWSIII